ncbi:MAG: DNA cytosine methyltransferase [Kiritimatiellae bacterium]|nr:DNA cytosine methyltransferase [Kiritimatiellia bacterium]
MPSPKVLNTVDLFCGAGGATTGLELALRRLGCTHKGLAINHWRVAVDTMSANHPDVETKQMSIEEAVPADLLPGGRVDLLWASPSCTHHSRAKGGKPRSNQLRAQPELIFTWVDQLFVRRLCVENVPEFIEWGPLSAAGKPIQSAKGACFRAWIAALEARRYLVEWRILNCADYGDATTRRRFFLQAVRRGCGRIVWPEPEYAENPQPDLWGRTPKKWRGIRECLDLSDTGTSIFNRERPLAENTLRRVFVGLRKFCGLDFQMDFLGADGEDDSRVRPTTAPLATQPAGGNRTALVRSFLVRFNRHGDAESIDAPLSAVTAGGQHHALCQPIVLDHCKNGEARPASDPVGSQTTHDRFSIVRAFLMNNNTNNAPRPLDKPMHAQTTGNHAAIVQPLVLGQQSGAECVPAEKPCPTIATAGAVRVVAPIVVDMSRPAGPDSGHINSTDDPIRTITTFDNLQGTFLLTEDGRVIDVRMRMLKPSELAAAHSFPADYRLTGNRTEQVKQIGNSVPVRTAAALCQAALSA